MSNTINTTALVKESKENEEIEEPKGPGLFSRAKAKTTAAGRKVKSVAGEGVGEVGGFISDRRANSKRALLQRQVELLGKIAAEDTAED